MASREYDLETLLRHRLRLEEASQLALADLKRQLDEQRLTEQDIERHLALALDEGAAQQSSSRLDLDAIGLTLTFVGSLREALVAQELVVRESEHRWDEGREQLLQASRDVKVIEKLKEVWLEGQRQELLRSDEKTAAESAIRRFGRREIGA